jgi:hypothetical protein
MLNQKKLCEIRELTQGGPNLIHFFNFFPTQRHAGRIVKSFVHVIIEVKLSTEDKME